MTTRQPARLTIHRYVLVWQPGWQSVAMPKGATILSVGVRSGELSVWAMVDDEQDQRDSRTFYLHETGETWDDDPYAPPRVFLGTAIFEPHGQDPRAAYVLHVWRDGS